MPKLIRLERLISEARRRDSLAREDAFWRGSMVPVSIIMGILIVGASVGLGVGANWNIFSDESMIWIVVAALVSIFALTKIVIANLLFYALANEDPRYPASGPGPDRRDRAPIPIRAVAESDLAEPLADHDQGIAAAVNE